MGGQPALEGLERVSPTTNPAQAAAPVSEAELRHGADAEPVATLRQLPVFCNALAATEHEARSTPRGDIELCYSPVTGYLWNRAFDPELVAYNPAYENSLHYSPRFAAFAAGLVDRLVSRYDLRGRRLVEIGCGEANFLAQLCEAGDNRGVGYDPSFDPARHKVTESDRVEVIADYYPVDRAVDADLVLCQHVLEHVPEPAALVSGVRRSLPATATPVYFEVPDATYMVEQLAVWDLIYEHYSYFAAPTLRWLFERAGFEVTEVGRTFGDQYLYLEARPGSAVGTGATEIGRDAAPPDRAALAGLTAAVSAFGAHLARLVTDWTARLDHYVGAGPVAVWGAGSKGVTFLNLVDAGAHVAHVVDVNPNKAGLFVPGTGQAIEGPDALAGGELATVLVMNPLYTEEIGEMLAARGLHPELVPVDS